MQQGGPSQGAGASPGGGGGRGAAGQDPERVDVDEAVDALKQQVGLARELIKSLNEVSNGVRKGEVDDELLGRLDIAKETGRRGGGEAFDRGKTENKEIGVLSRDPDDPQGDTARREAPREKVYESDETANVTETVTVKTGDLPPDKIRKLVESGKVAVSPEYRRLIERYFGEISEK